MMPPLDTNSDKAKRIRELKAKIEAVTKAEQETVTRCTQLRRELDALHDKKKHEDTLVHKIETTTWQDFVQENAELKEQLECDDAFSSDAVENCFNWLNLKMAQHAVFGDETLRNFSFSTIKWWSEFEEDLNGITEQYKAFNDNGQHSIVLALKKAAESGNPMLQAWAANFMQKVHDRRFYLVMRDGKVLADFPDAPRALRNDEKSRVMMEEVVAKPPGQGGN